MQNQSVQPSFIDTFQVHNHQTILENQGVILIEHELAHEVLCVGEIRMHLVLVKHQQLLNLNFLQNLLIEPVQLGLIIL